MTFSTKLYEALHRDPDRPMMDYQGRFYTAGQLAGFGDKVVALLEAGGIPKDASIGIVLRNRPLHAAAVLALIAAGRPLTSIYAMQSVEAMAADIAASRFATVLADIQDWTDPVRTAAARAGSLAISLRLDDPDPVRSLPGLERAGPGPFRSTGAEPSLEMLSSGTTGAPKRILFPYRVLVRTVESVVLQFDGGPATPHIESLPLTGIGGMASLIVSGLIGRYTALLEKFNVAEWVEAARRLRPTIGSGPPTIPRMLLDAKVAQEDVSSLKYWFGGGAAFPPELQDEFEQAYGIEVLWAYGATEFCGTLISWTPALRAEFGTQKRGAVGRVLPGNSVRVVDTTTGEPLAAGQEGYLEALIPSLGPDWIKTTDLMVIDEDGFAYHRGRGDGAILRGGFKVLPEKIIDALLAHPAVLDAGVVGIPDPRLGQLPVAAVELRQDQPKIDEDALRSHTKRLLLAHYVPARILIVDKLPRTTSLKVNQQALRQMFQGEAPH